MTRGQAEVALVDAPPLDGATHVQIRLDHRSASFRWLLATVLMAAVAAVLLIGAIYSTLGPDGRFAAAPLVLVPRLTRQLVAEAGRGDPAKPEPARHHHGRAVRVEQLDSSGSALRPFTHLFARLDQVAQEALTADRDPARVPSEPIGRGSGENAPVNLPKPIPFKTSHASAPESASAYAATDEMPSTAKFVLGDPVNVSVVAEGERRDRRHVVVTKAGDTLHAILEGLGTTPGDARDVASLLREGETFSGGEVITVLEEASANTLTPARPLKITIEHPRAAAIAIARADSGSYVFVSPEQADAEPSSPDAAPRNAPASDVSSGERLRDSLYALARYNHLDEPLVDDMVRLCGHDFDLEEPVFGSDSVDLLYAPDARGEPELMFLALTAHGQSRRYYRFTAPDDGSTDYYDGDGQSVSKFLLRKPVSEGRLGDGFGWRTHPILRDRRFHEGVDYAAPYGSPIAAAGAGVVEIIGQQWGYGKYIRIRHDLGYETTYAHVAGFPRGLKVGDRVRQGETIAYVGSTGLSTGPHLYYEVRINGHNVDPLRIKLADGRVLKGDVLAGFQRERERVDELVGASTLAKR